MTQAPVPDSVLISYGLLAGGVRLAVPAVIDIPFVRAVRGAMFDKLARAAGITLSVEARRVLVDLEDPASGRGVAGQALRWAVGRFVPGGVAMDAFRGVLRTYAAGALFARYLDKHRPEPREPVLSGREAAHVRESLRAAIERATVRHVQAIARVVMDGVRAPHGDRESPIVERWGDALFDTVAELPLTWMNVLDDDFVRTLGPGASS